MKKFFFFAACMVFAVASMAQAPTDEIALLQSMYGIGKKDLVAEAMKVTEAEKATFWAIYDEYEAARKEIGKKRAANIIDYAEHYEALTNENATQIVKTSVEVNAAFTKLLDKTFKKMSKAISPLRAAQFYQVELFLEGIVRVRMADEIPLIEGIDEKK